jgi:hypothetical protein
MLWIQVRRQGEVVQKLAHMIGTSVKLYDMVLQFLRTLFLRTRNIHYCTLRAELLMALHDLEVQVITISVEIYFIFCPILCLKVLSCRFNELWTGELLTKKVWMYDVVRMSRTKHSLHILVGKNNSVQNSCHEGLIVPDEK